MYIQYDLERETTIEIGWAIHRYEFSLKFEEINRNAQWNDSAKWWGIYIRNPSTV